MKYQFADCLLDTDRHMLERGGVELQTEPQVFDLLLLLLENSGRLVTRDEIVSSVWQGRIVSESAISARISAARKAVGDDGKAQAVIRTVARRGLMLVAEVTDSDVEPVRSAPVARATVQRIRYARNTDGHQLAYAITGEGPDVLRFPPPHTMDLEYEWRIPSERRFIDCLSDQFRYVRFDHVGSGQSERVDPKFDFAAQAEDACAVADAAGVEKFAGFSLSGGVLAAIHFATRFPERLSRLVIIGGYADGRLKRGQSNPSDALKTMIAEGWGKPGSAFATGFLTSYFPEGPLEDVHEIVKMMQAASTPETMLHDRDAINSASVAHLLKHVQCPTLILHSRHDAVHPLSEAQKLAAGIPNAELVILETANHVPLPGNAAWEQFMDTLVDFLGR